MYFPSQLLIHEVDKKTNKPGKKKPKFVKKGGMVVVRIEVNQPVCIETYKSFPQLGRFTLRDEGKRKREKGNLALTRPPFFFVQGKLLRWVL